MAHRDEEILRKQDSGRKFREVSFIFLAILVLLLSAAIPFRNEILVRYIQVAMNTKNDYIRSILIPPIEDYADSTFFEPLFILASRRDIFDLDPINRIIKKKFKHLNSDQLKKLKDYVRSSNSKLQNAAFHAYDLYSVKHPNSNFIPDLLNDTDENVRVRTMLHLVNNPFNENLDAAIRSLKTDPSLRVKVLACSILQHSGDERAVDPLIEALSDKEARVRQSAVIALGDLCEIDGYCNRLYGNPIRRKPVAPLVKLLNDPDKSVLLAVIEALGLINDKRAVEPLLKMLSDPDKKVRAKAVRVLGDLDDKRAVEPLIKMLSNPDKEIREETIEVLGDLDDKRAVEPLLKFISDSDVDIRHITIYSLGSIGDNRALKPILQRLKTGKDSDNIHVMIRAVRILGDASKIHYVLPYLKDKNELTRSAAVEALGEIGTPDVIPELEKIQKNDKEDSSVQGSAKNSIEMIQKRYAAK